MKVPTSTVTLSRDKTSRRQTEETSVRFSELCVRPTSSSNGGIVATDVLAFTRTVAVSDVENPNPSVTSAKYEVVVFDRIGRYARSSQISDVRVVNVPVTWAVPTLGTANVPFKKPDAFVSTATTEIGRLAKRTEEGPRTLTSTRPTRSKWNAPV